MLIKVINNLVLELKMHLFYTGKWLIKPTARECFRIGIRCYYARAIVGPFVLAYNA